MFSFFRTKPSVQIKSKQRIDITLFLTVLGLTGFGLIAVYNSSIYISYRLFNNPYHFVQDQAVYAGVGIIILLIISRIDYHFWYQMSVPLLFAVLILLIAVFIPGFSRSALGAQRWISIGEFSLQPTEFAKFALVVYLAAWFSYKERSRLWPFILLMSLVLSLIILQPDVGTAVIILSIAGLLYFISGAPIYQFIFLIPAAVGGLVLLSVKAAYRLKRLTTFFNINADPLGTSYHLNQILIAIGSGGWWGIGFGKSRQKYGYLPETHTDSIFAIVAEEIGFLGTLVLISVYFYLAYQSFEVARHAPDRFGQLLGAGIAIWFTIQTLINLSAMVALAPLTGIPLPFISYGGSSLISLMMGFAILLNISKHKDAKKKGKI